jgi:mitochondrial fission protein ELM1
MRSVGFQPAEALKVWAVSDGRAGIENQALGLAEALSRRTPVALTTKRIELRSPWSWLPPGFVPAPRQALTIGSDPIEAPWPDVFIACGRAATPFALGMREWSRGKTFVVVLQDPRVNPREFDVVIPPIHDGLEGQNVLPIVGACHRVTHEKIAEAVASYPQALEDLPSPRFAVLIGGKSKRQDISAKRARAIADSLAQVHIDGHALAAHQHCCAIAVSNLSRAALRALLRGRRREPLLRDVGRG